MTGGRRDEQLRAQRPELPGARHEVGVEVRLGRVRDVQTAPLGFSQVAGRVAHRVDDQGAPIPEVDEIRRVAESVVDE